MCHYPMLSWKHCQRSYMIQGHIHNDTEMDFWPLLATRSNVLNAGVDINFFQPVTFEELVANNEWFKGHLEQVNQCIGYKPLDDSGCANN